MNLKDVLKLQNESRDEYEMFLLKLANSLGIPSSYGSHSFEVNDNTWKASIHFQVTKKVSYNEYHPIAARMEWYDLPNLEEIRSYVLTARGLEKWNGNNNAPVNKPEAIEAISSFLEIAQIAAKRNNARLRNTVKLFLSKKASFTDLKKAIS